MIKVLALLAVGFMLGGCGMTVATPRPHPVAASVHAGPPPAHAGGYGYRRGAERRPVCEEGDRFDPHIGKCVGERVYLEPGSKYDVSPEKARCVPGSSREFFVDGPAGPKSRLIRQTCNLR